MTSNLAKRATKPHQKALPVSGELLPVVGLGTWQTFDVPEGPARAALLPVLETFFALGGRLIDTSPMYGHAEEAVGSLLAGLRLPHTPFIATKVWTRGKLEGVRQMEDSMRRLRVQTLGLMQVHNLVDADRHLDTLAEWKAKGRVRYLGVTHYTASGAEEILNFIRRRPVEFVQINYSVDERAAERHLLPYCLEHGIAVIANRPLGGGEALRAVEGRPLPEFARDIGCDSWSALLLKFVLSHPAITCAIPATSSVTHLRENLQAAYGPLPDETMRLRILDAVEST